MEQSYSLSAGRLTARKIIAAEDAKAWRERLPKVQPQGISHRGKGNRVEHKRTCVA
jgi:hypothetical protein